MSTRIDLPVDVSALPEDALVFMEAIAIDEDLVHESPVMLPALSRTLVYERRRRAANLPECVWFSMIVNTLADAERAASTSLDHAIRCTDSAREQTDQAAGDAWVAMAKVFLTIHRGIVEAVDPDTLRAFRVSMLSPPTAAIN